jgi:hypothetical protein
MSTNKHLGRPVIVEGVCLCQVLQEVGRSTDFLVWVENEGGPRPSPNERTAVYFRQFRPKEKANYRLVWMEPELSISR